MVLSTKSALNLDFHANLVAIYLNGLYTAVFLITMYGIYFKMRVEKPQRHFTAAWTAMMYLLSTIFATLHWYTIWKGFVAHGDTPEDAHNAITGVPLWIGVLGIVAFSLNTLVADCLFIWRCWVIWGYSWKAAFGPALLTLVGTVFSILADVAQINQIVNKHSTSVFITSKVFRQSGIIYLAFSSATTILVTALITFRILQVYFSNRKVFMVDCGSQRNRLYSHVLEIVIESAMLYTIAELSLLILLAKQDSNYIYAQNLVSQMTGIAPTLIILRISLGVARPSSTWTNGASVGRIEFAAPLDFSRSMRATRNDGNSSETEASPESGSQTEGK